MKIIFAKLLTAATFLLFAIPAFAIGKPARDARNSSEQWLALIDAGKSSESWQMAANYFRSTISREQWQHSLGAVRRTLGDLVSRKLKSVTYTKSIPGEPDGEYMVLQFDSSFANRKMAYETVTPKLDWHGKWRVCGYRIHLCSCD